MLIFLQFYSVIFPFRSFARRREKGEYAGGIATVSTISKILKHPLKIETWDDLIVLKVGHRKAEERCQFYLEAGNLELAKLASDTISILFKEMKVIEKEIEKLESRRLSGIF